MSTLTEYAQKHIERVMRELSDDEDFMPFMTLRDHQDGVVYVGMEMPDEEEAKAQLADYMTALCMVHRAVEVTFATVAWMVRCKGDELPDVMPSQHPDRTEQVFLLVMDTGGQRKTHTATVVRENNMVGVGLWSENEHMVVEGRFADAINHGIGLGRELPQELCEWVDDEAEAGRLDEIVAKFATTIDEARKTAQKMFGR